MLVFNKEPFMNLDIFSLIPLYYVLTECCPCFFLSKINECCVHFIDSELSLNMKLTVVGFRRFLWNFFLELSEINKKKGE